MKTLACLLSVAIMYVGVMTAQADEAPITVLVAYYSKTGHTEKMAHAIKEGAKEVPGTTVLLKRVEDVNASELFSADALIVGSPVYWSNMAGEVENVLR